MQGYQLAYKSDYATAVKHLEFAFLHCMAGSMVNKRLILMYLIPLKLLEVCARVARINAKDFAPFNHIC